MQTIHVSDTPIYMDKQSSDVLSNESYYDAFAEQYENGRDKPYHRLLDDLEVDLASRYAKDKDVLEVGCGTGLVLSRVAQVAQRAEGIDLSQEMLQKAKDRGLSVQKADATALPFGDNEFDVVYSFKVLAHLQDIQAALLEMARVTRPGGIVLAEFYNPISLRYCVKKLKKPTKIAAGAHDENVFTRFDTPRAAKKYFPANLIPVSARGIRIVTPVSHVHNWPIVGAALRKAETWLADVPLFRALAGFYVVIARKQ